MKMFVVSDVHGFYDEMKWALDNASFDRNNPDHFFVSLGDLLDRGPQAAKCLEFVMGLDPERRVFIRGNHEDLMEDAIIRGKFLSHDHSNGTVDTVRQLTGENDHTAGLLLMREAKMYNAYIRECVNWAESDRYVFVHGWIPCRKIKKMSQYDTDHLIYQPYDDWRKADDATWREARWVNGMDAWNCGVRDDQGKTIVCGHWHCSWGNCFLHSDGLEFPRYESQRPLVNWNPFVDDGIIAIDACTVLSGIVNCVVLDEDDEDDDEKEI